MSFVVRKCSLAETDAAETACWYEAKSSGLGGDFLAEVEAAFTSLERDALHYSVRFSDVRCLRLQRFTAYGVYYVVRGAEVWVLAVLHGAREIGAVLQRRQSQG